MLLLFCPAPLCDWGRAIFRLLFEVGCLNSRTNSLYSDVECGVSTVIWILEFHYFDLKYLGLSEY
jgi:hypothetical protein